MADSLTLPTVAVAADTAPSKLHLLHMLPEELAAWCESQSMPKYRADQLVHWIYERGVDDYAAMANLPKSLRATLAEQATIYTGSVVCDSAANDGTHKLLVEFPPAAQVESVWIPDGARNTACISSQVGCPVGCKFCASGLDGVERNLTAGEIVEQVMWVRSVIHETTGGDGRLSNIVFMGMGEPLANYDNLIRALRIINHPKAIGLGARRITISTVGLPAQIRKLARENLQVNLALSLHAPTDELRQSLIPWGKVPIRELLAACREYFDQTGREITLEYILLRGVNMDTAAARELARIVRSLRCNVNLLRYNPVPGLSFERPSAADSYAFQEKLREAGVNAHLRKSRGRDIDAACGQLRRNTQAESTPA